MGRLLVWDLVSLDGYFEGPNSDLSFMQYAWGPELEGFINAQASDFGTLVFGRRTYEGMATYWRDKTDYIGKIMNSTPKVVFSDSLLKAEWKNSRIAKGDLRAGVDRIKRETSKDAFVLGSANLVARLAEENLIDEYRIGVVSLVLGKGTHLFRDVTKSIPLRLVEARQLGHKIVLLRYLPPPAK